MPVPANLETLAVIGNGIIGHGVAQVYAVAKKDVLLIGRSDESLARAIGNIRASLTDFQRHGLVSADDAEAAVARIRPSTNLADAAEAQLVVEAVTHDMPLKVELFAELDRICPPPTVLATSSGSPASDVHGNVEHRERVIATHFWYPPQLIPLRFRWQNYVDIFVQTVTFGSINTGIGARERQQKAPVDTDVGRA